MTFSGINMLPKMGRWALNCFQFGQRDGKAKTGFCEMNVHLRMHPRMLCRLLDAKTKNPQLLMWQGVLWKYSTFPNISYFSGLSMKLVKGPFFISCCLLVPESSLSLILVYTKWGPELTPGIFGGGEQEWVNGVGAENFTAQSNFFSKQEKKLNICSCSLSKQKVPESTSYGDKKTLYSSSILYSIIYLNGLAEHPVLWGFSLKLLFYP